MVVVVFSVQCYVSESGVAFFPASSFTHLHGGRNCEEKVAYPSTSFYLGKLILRDKQSYQVTDNRIHSGQTQDNRSLPALSACFAYPRLCR